MTHDQDTPPNDGGIPEFDRLLRQHHTQLFGYIHSLVRDLNDAEDILQQTTLVLWKKFSFYDRQHSFLAWGCGVARLEVSNFFRVRGRNRLYFSDDLNLLLIESQCALGNDEFDARRDALRECVKKLRDRDRQLLTTCYSTNQGVIDAARASGRHSQSIHNSLRRIRRALFGCIERTLNQESHPEAVG